MPRGGKRPGAGRKPSNPPRRDVKLYITEEQVKLLRKWGRGDASAGLRWLIDTAALLVTRPEQKKVEEKS